MPDVTSAYPSFKPRLVARWENHIDNADSDEEAQTQLAYNLLVELRVIRLLLIWVLIVVPAVAAVVLIALLNNATPASPGF